MQGMTFGLCLTKFVDMTKIRSGECIPVQNNGDNMEVVNQFSQILAILCSDRKTKSGEDRFSEKRKRDAWGKQLVNLDLTKAPPPLAPQAKTHKTKDPLANSQTHSTDLGKSKQKLYYLFLSLSLSISRTPNSKSFVCVGF